MNTVAWSSEAVLRVHIEGLMEVESDRWRYCRETRYGWMADG